MNGTADESLRRGQELYAAARFVEAEAELLRVVSARPNDVSSLVLLGSVIGQLNRHEEAAAWLERARDADPTAPEPWKALGLIYRRQGRMDDAVAAYERALALEPDDAATHVNLAVALKARGELSASVRQLEAAIALQPRLRAAYFNLANCRFEQGELDQAGAAYLQCLRLDPRDSAAALGVAKVLREQRRFDMAEKTLRSAARLVPDDQDIQATLGVLAHDMGRSEEAHAILSTVLRLQPRNFLALLYLGNVERDVGHLVEADALYRQALELVPDDIEALFNLAATLADKGRWSEAKVILDGLRQRHPNNAHVRYRCALALLAEGDFEQGWTDYAWRAQTPEHRAVRFCHLPRLDAPSFAGRKVVIWGDQGVGDEIIYGSFLVDLRAQAANLVCEIDRRLVSLFRRGFPEIAFVERTFQPNLPSSVTEDAARDVWRSARLDARFADATDQIALPDLGRWLRPGFERFPAHAGYLRADEERVAQFRRWVDKRPGETVIGLSWVSRNKDLMRYKSLDLRAVVEALPTDGVRLISLQYGDVGGEIAALERATSRRVEVAPGLDYFTDIDGVAALVMACDIVLTVSAVTVHYAGSLGKKTALLCPGLHGKPWYWFRDRADSPWYPTVRIFRQTADGSWAGALGEAAAWIVASG